MIEEKTQRINVQTDTCVATVALATGETLLHTVDLIVIPIIDGFPPSNLVLGGKLYNL
jgi:hypothetical protein